MSGSLKLKRYFAPAAMPAFALASQMLVHMLSVPQRVGMYGTPESRPLLSDSQLYAPPDVRGLGEDVGQAGVVVSKTTLASVARGTA